MKKTSLYLIVFLFSLAVMLTLTSEKGIESAVITNGSHESCYNCTSNSFNGLTPSEFARGVKKYRNTHLKAAETTLRADFSDAKVLARMCWFSLDTLKQFICLIEKAAQLDNISTSELGIDFSYAVYPMETMVNIQDRRYNYSNLHTLFMVPTRFVQDKGNVAMAINSTLKNSVPLTEMMKRAADKDKKLLMLTTGLSAIDSKNQGQLCPPTCSEAMQSLIQGADNYPTSETW